MSTHSHQASRDAIAELAAIEAPWLVRRVDIDPATMTATVHVAHAYRTAMLCPTCGLAMAHRHDTVTRRWRDRNCFDYRMFLSAEVPRVKCPEHGVHRIKTPWESRQQVQTTMRFEREVLALLKQCSARGVARQLGITDQQVGRIQHDAVARGKARRTQTAVAAIGVDETSFRKGHRYVTIVNDLQGRALHVAPGKDAAALASYFKQLDDAAIGALATVTMDMSPAYIRAVNTHTDATIVFDKFHVIMALNKVVDQVRRAEMKRTGDARLKWSRHLLHRSAAAMTADESSRLATLKRGAFKVARVWKRIEWARGLFDAVNAESAERGWRAWMKSARLSRIAPLRNVADTIDNHLYGIVNASVTGLTNAMAESMNSKIQKVKGLANGYRNVDNFCDAILFHCGGLDMAFD